MTRPFPDTWQPGTNLTLFGPLGNGFRLPADVQRLALIALGDTSSRLLPLVSNLKMPQASITLFSDAQSTDLPPDVEAYPIQDLPASLDWADFFAVDSPLERLGGIGGGIQPTCAKTGRFTRPSPGTNQYALLWLGKVRGVCVKSQAGLETELRRWPGI